MILLLSCPRQSFHRERGPPEGPGAVVDVRDPVDVVEFVFGKTVPLPSSSRVPVEGSFSTGRSGWVVVGVQESKESRKGPTVEGAWCPGNVSDKEVNLREMKKEMDPLKNSRDQLVKKVSLRE